MKKAHFFFYLIVGGLLMSRLPHVSHAMPVKAIDRIEYLANRGNQGAGDKKKSRRRWIPKKEKLKEQQDNPRQVYYLDVPFITQVPPGVWGKTNNCGQAVFLMIYCYYYNLTPSPEQIKKIDEWLYANLELPINDYNGSKTTSKIIEKLALGYGNMSEARSYVNFPLEKIRTLLKEGHPVKASIRYPSPGHPEIMINHAVLIIGISRNSIWIHDPGTVRGEAQKYRLETFLEYWEALGKRVSVFNP